MRLGRTPTWIIASLLLAGGPVAATHAFEGIKLEKPTAENSEWSPHHRMTTSAMLAALGDLGCDPRSPAAKRLASECAVGDCLVDWDEMSFDGPILRCNERYRPFHHFDRAPDAPHREALAAGIEYIAKAAGRLADHLRHAEAAASVSDETRKALVAELAGILHVSQDLFSHSNIADDLDATLQEEAAALLARAVAGGAGKDGDAAPELPARLAAAVKVTAFSPSQGGDPPDSGGYTHDKHAKDGEKAGEGFRKAYALAEKASKRVILALLGRSGGAKAAAVLLGS